ncbi:cytochrome c oxidase assembly protein [Arthrobacter sp.]|uniref:cytochrome c oxidase assembly protein n=1 Tax=Arthrobacter sp. TaxID=1667 RepID=UPI0026DF6B01|nr:cytochrome c oxidase assembly protein [Arthrobacter sp.]MDO5751500.1 cytochrome c oxidase assembly protein [Arthrobacter sp.]
MPTLGDFLGTWSLDAWALGFILALGGLYAWGLATASRVGVSWPLWRIASFYIVGLGCYAAISFGFLGTYSLELRWAFSIRIALLLFVVPSGLALGLPLGLARLTIHQGRVRRFLAALVRKPVQLFSNSAVPPILGLLVLSMMLTPLAGITRMSPFWEGLLGIGIPLLGLLMVLPMVEEKTRVSSALIMLQFVFAFIELLADAIPGLLMRLTPTIFDGATVVGGARASWFPSALADQQLAGDWMWFIAEIMDLPILILLLVRLAKSDKGERKILDELTDEQMDELNAAHLHLRG